MTGSGFVRVTKLALPVLAVLLAMPGISYAQRITAELSGSVVDSSGAVVPGADVVLTNEGSGDVRRSVTNSDGFFNFASVPAQDLHPDGHPSGIQDLRGQGRALHAGDFAGFRQIKLEVTPWPRPSRSRPRSRSPR